MNLTDIVTGQFVHIQQTPASTWQRLGGVLLDWLFCGTYLFLVFTAISELFPPTRYDDSALLIIAVIPVVLYPVVCETFMGGQTAGKWLFRTRVVRTDGGAPTLSAYLLRFLLLPVDLLFLGAVAAFSMLITSNHQRLGDVVAGTMVIKLQSYDRIRVDLELSDYEQELSDNV